MINYKVKIENTNQLSVILENDLVSDIIIARDSFAESDLPKLVNKIKSCNKNAWILMERISRYEEAMNNGNKLNDLRKSTDEIFELQNLDGIVIQNLDSFVYMLRKINKAKNDKLKVELNYTMNCYNNETKLVLEKLYNEKRNNAVDVPLLFTAPVELNTYELEDVGYDTMILYSYIDTMATANCLRKNTSEPNTAARKTRGYSTGELCEPTCKYRFNFDKMQDFSSYIIDRKGKKLHYKTYCKYCYNKIFNTEPLYLLDKIDELKAHSCMCKNNKRAGTDCNQSMGEPSYRLDFSFETENEVRNILNKKIPESFTRGHFKNSIK